MTVICGIKMESETILWMCVLSLVIVFPERRADNSPQDIPLACAPSPRPSSTDPLFFSKTGLIFRADRTVLPGPKHQNVGRPTGMTNDTDRDLELKPSLLLLKKSHPRAPAVRPFLGTPRAAAKNLSPASLYPLWASEGIFQILPGPRKP